MYKDEMASICRAIPQSVPTELLNAVPTYSLCVPFCIVFACTSYFLDLYVVSSTPAHIATFVVGAYVVGSSYFVADYFLKAYSASYVQIPEKKRFYVLSNLIKSACLFAYSPLAARLLYSAMVHDVWETSTIRNLGVLYAIPDFVSLVLVRRMAPSTVLHHLVVVGFMVANLHIDYADVSIARALVVYAIFSTFAYLVNLLLASRFLNVGGAWVTFFLATMALVVYTSCLALNWTYQVHFISWLHLRAPSEVEQPAILSTLGYVLAISFVVYDDVVLCRWLKSNVERKWREAREGSSPRKRSPPAHEPDGPLQRVQGPYPVDAAAGQKAHAE